MASPDGDYRAITSPIITPVIAGPTWDRAPTGEIIINGPGLVYKITPEGDEVVGYWPAPVDLNVYPKPLGWEAGLRPPRLRRLYWDRIEVSRRLTDMDRERVRLLTVRETPGCGDCNRLRSF